MATIKKAGDAPDATPATLEARLRADGMEPPAGDRLEIEPRTAHAATVGPDGVSCVEGGG